MSSVNTPNTITSENDVEENINLPQNPMPKRKIDEVNDVPLEINDSESKKPKTSSTTSSILNLVLERVKEQKAIKTANVPVPVPVESKNTIIKKFILDISFFGNPLRNFFTSIITNLSEFIPNFDTNTYRDITRNIASSLEEATYMLCDLNTLQTKFLVCPPHIYYTIILIYLADADNDFLIINRTDIREGTNYSIFDGFLLKMKIIIRLLSAPISNNMIFRKHYTTKQILNNLLVLIDNLNIILWNCVCYPVKVNTFTNILDKCIYEKAKNIYSLMEHLKRKTSLTLSEFE